MPASPDIWITRPQPVAERTAKGVAALGLTPLVVPLLGIKPLPATLPPTPPWPKGWIFTSRHAAHALRALLMPLALSHPSLDELRLLPVWCVGTRTAEAAIAAGFPYAQCMGENGAALVRRLGARLESMRGPRTVPYDLWYAASRTRRHDLAALLSPWEVSVQVMELYDSIPVTQMPPAAQAAIRSGQMRAVLLYSPETARAFGRVLAESGLEAEAAGLVLFCLSQAVADACPKHCAHRIVAPRPSEACLLQSLDEWANKA